MHKKNKKIKKVFVKQLDKFIRQRKKDIAPLTNP